METATHRHPQGCLGTVGIAADRLNSVWTQMYESNPPRNNHYNKNLSLRGEGSVAQSVVQNSIGQVLAGERKKVPPVWMMRQAGRYLPEYRELRKKAGTFLDLCLTPKMAAEVTLQPIDRFGFDAAILFSDILVIPHALGQRVTYVEGEGPRLDPVQFDQGLAELAREFDGDSLCPVYDTIGLVKARLPADVALLGFCGAPWTVATYMIAGRGTPDQAPARLAAYRDPQTFSELIDILVRASSRYLIRQFQAGVDAVQIFDTWAG